MAFDAQIQIRDNALELQDFLKDLTQWEKSVKEKDKSLKSQAQQEGVPPIHGRVSATRERNKLPHKDKQADLSVGVTVKSGGVVAGTAASHTYDHSHDKWDKFDVDAALRKMDEEEDFQVKQIDQGDASLTSFPQAAQRSGAIQTTSSLCNEDSFVDAATEKELGNQLFKEKKFVQAIDHYSRSIALQPSAVAYANRAMAYLKIRRFKEAEADCTESIALDDRYVKAYSRRGTVRKELGMYLSAAEDAEFALRLDPENKELKNQYLEAKSMCEKVGDQKDNKKTSIPIEEVSSGEAKYMDKKIHDPANEGSGADSGISKEPMMPVSKPQKRNVNVVASIQAAAARAAASRESMQFMAPKNFYEFQAMWKSFSGQLPQQAEIMKAINPSGMPDLFKDNLSPRLLIEILHSLTHLFPKDAIHAIEVLKNLTNVRRFSMTVMCLRNKEKTELREVWEQAFLGCNIGPGQVQKLKELEKKFML